MANDRVNYDVMPNWNTNLYNTQLYNFQTLLDPYSNSVIATDEKTGITLNAICKADLPTLAFWRNSENIRVRTREFKPLNEIEQEKWLNGISGSDKNIMFLVCNNRISVGVVGLCGIDYRNGTAEISFYIGKKEMQRTGNCFVALNLLIGYGFNELRLNRIFAEVFDFNVPCIKLLEKLNFKHEGTLRSHVFRLGKHSDSLMYGLLKEEYNASS